MITLNARSYPSDDHVYNDFGVTHESSTFCNAQIFCEGTETFPLEVDSEGVPTFLYRTPYGAWFYYGLENSGSETKRLVRCLYSSTARKLLKASNLQADWMPLEALVDGLRRGREARRRVLNYGYHQYDAPAKYAAWDRLERDLRAYSRMSLDQLLGCLQEAVMDNCRQGRGDETAGVRIQTLVQMTRYVPNLVRLHVKEFLSQDGRPCYYSSALDGGLIQTNYLDQGRCGGTYKGRHNEVFLYDAECWPLSWLLDMEDTTVTKKGEATYDCYSGGNGPYQPKEAVYRLPNGTWLHLTPGEECKDSYFYRTNVHKPHQYLRAITEEQARALLGSRIEKEARDVLLEREMVAEIHDEAPNRFQDGLIGFCHGYLGTVLRRISQGQAARPAKFASHNYSSEETPLMYDTPAVLWERWLSSGVPFGS